MIRVLASFAIVMGLMAGLPAAPGLAVKAQAQDSHNDLDDRTPLNSRIPRSRPLPTEPRSVWMPRQLSDAQRARGRTMVDQMARCLWGRSNEDGLDLLARTDFGFMSFEQIGIPTGEVSEHYAISTCLNRVARNANSGVMLRFDAPSMRRWYIQAAYFDRNEDGPEWIRPGYVVAEREYPLSGDNLPVQVAMNFADCLVVQDPHGADYLFRTAPGSDEEMAAIQGLIPAMQPCLPQGQQMEIDPYALRVWVGEGLWHASNNLVPAPTENAEDSE